MKKINTMALVATLTAIIAPYFAIWYVFTLPMGIFWIILSFICAVILSSAIHTQISVIWPIGIAALIMFVTYLVIILRTAAWPIILEQYRKTKKLTIGK